MTQRSIAADLGLSLAMGFCIALGYLYFAGGFLASVAAGTVTMFLNLCAVRVFGEFKKTGEVITATASGTIGGLTWWAIADTTSAIWAPTCIGAAAVLLLYAVEEGIPWVWKRLTRSAA